MLKKRKHRTNGRGFRIWSRVVDSAICVLVFAQFGCADADTRAGSGIGVDPTNGATAISTVVILPGATAQGSQAFGDNPLTVSAGTSITWINKDRGAHSIASDAGVWNATIIRPGQSFTYRFNDVGYFGYHCDIYGKDRMSGTVRVQ